METMKPRASRTPATTPADILLTVRSLWSLKDEGKMRKLHRRRQLLEECFRLENPYAIIIIEADKVADAFQYHFVRSFSL